MSGITSRCAGSWERSWTTNPAVATLWSGTALGDKTNRPSSNSV